MHNVLILACCFISLSFSSGSLSTISPKLDIPLSKNGTLLKTIVEKISPKSLDKVNASHPVKKINTTIGTKFNRTEKIHNFTHQNNHSKDEDQKNFPILHKIHARITRSKDAVWATITLTFMCVLLVLAVAQSRMWKDHYYSESQGVPLPNFNERVLFKDVMEHKISSLKKFFKKKPKENVTELESLLPPSEWDD